MAIRFVESQARGMGRNTRGVKGISLIEGDEVIGMVVADPAGALLTVCENGYGKRTPFGPNTAGEEAPEVEVEEETPETAVDDAEEPRATASGMRYRKQKRGGKGVRDIRTSDRNGPVVGVTAVSDNDDIMLITIQGMVNRTHVQEIRMVGRNTQGVRIMNLREGDKIASLAKVAHEEVEDEAPSADGVPPAE
jgi:DNA gyrase subunit A